MDTRYDTDDTLKLLIICENRTIQYNYMYRCRVDVETSTRVQHLNPPNLKSAGKFEKVLFLHNYLYI